MVDMASDKNEASGADESLPCIIYVILKALPPRVYSTLQFKLLIFIINSMKFSFINLFRNHRKMLS